jgi:capsular polysaccharide transport system ATP-binding protein
MSICLRDIFVPASYPEAVRPLFDGLEIEIPAGARIGLLGTSKSGKSTLLRLMCGTAVAERGWVERNSRVSWPIPVSTFFSMSGTVAQNIRFVARLYGAGESDLCRRVARSAGLDEYLAVPLQKCPPFVRPRLALILAVEIEFDIYLFDGSLCGTDKTFKDEAAKLVPERIAGRGYVLATANPNEAEKKCDAVYVLDAERARYFADADEGIKHLKDLLAAQKAKPPSRREKRAYEEDGEVEALGDIDMVTAAGADAVD